MANFRPKRPVTGDVGEYYSDTLENFLKRRSLKKRSRLDNEPINGGNNAQNDELLQMRKQTEGGVFLRGRMDCLLS